MANIRAVRKALAAQLQTELKIKTHSKMPAVITPPVMMVLPGGPYIQYGVTMGEQADALEAFGSVLGEVTHPQSKNNIMLTVLVCISTAQGYENMQDALDDLLEPAGNKGSIANAIATDESLGGAADFAVPIDVTGYGLVNVAGQDYFGAHIRVQIGT